VSIAICFLARTGLVMGTDSRVTTTGPEGKTREDAYPKLVQYGRLPVGMAMVGAGSYGGRDFRSLVAETHRAACPDGKTFGNVESVARAFADIAGGIARESGARGPDGKTVPMTVLVGGFSPGEAFGELWEVTLPQGDVQRQAAPRSQTFVWRGRADAIKTLWWGANLGVLNRVLREHEVPDEEARAIVADVKKGASWGPERIAWGMPLSSAVDLVRFQLEVQIQAERFLPGRSACGAPVQLLAINDTGLHWVEQPFPAFSAIGC